MSKLLNKVLTFANYIAGEFNGHKDQSSVRSSIPRDRMKKANSVGRETIRKGNTTLENE